MGKTNRFSKDGIARYLTERLLREKNSAENQKCQTENTVVFHREELF